MEALCISDLHGDFETLKKVSEAAKDFETIVVAGDFTHFSSANVAEHMLKSLIGNVKNLVIVPGNCDLEKTSELYNDLGINLHGAGVFIEDIGFFGLGGSNITPFNTAFEIMDDEITSILERGYQKVKDSKFKVLVSHAPPFGTVDKTSSGTRAGSKAIKEFLESNEVDLVICGHVHEGRGSAKLGKTLVINTGPARGGYLKLSINKEGNISHEFIEF
jgi:Icc-related predicted phosphoesterase